MLLALDAGNTNITIGAFEDAILTGRWRLRTVHEQTADEWGVLLRNLFALNSLDLSRVDGIIIASVVPPLDSTLAAMTRRYFHRE
ncbi:MAG: type III pantothenate kinase, partial [Bryobacteraceae bacterium]